MTQEKRLTIATKQDGPERSLEAGCLFAILTDKRSVSRRNRATWFLGQLNKLVKCDEDGEIPIPGSTCEPCPQQTTKQNNEEQDHSESSKQAEDEADIKTLSITSQKYPAETKKGEQQYLVTPNTRVLYLSKSVATSIILDLSPSIASVTPGTGSVLLDSLFDALKKTLQLLVKSHEIPSSSETKPPVLDTKVLVSVIAYTPFVVAKSNQVLIQNRRISSTNIEQVLVEIWICLDRLTQEIHELVTSTYGMDLDFGLNQAKRGVFSFTQPIAGGIIRHPGTVLEDIFEIGLFSSSLMPRLSRLSLIVITDGLFSLSSNLNLFRLKSIAVSFVSLGNQTTYPDSCFGYTPFEDPMRFISKSTQGVFISYHDLISASQKLPKTNQVPFMGNPFNRLFCWALHSSMFDDSFRYLARKTNSIPSEQTDDPLEVKFEQVAKYFCVDQPISNYRQSSNVHPDNNSSGQLSYLQAHHDWQSSKRIERNLDADFEQVLSSLLREGYLVKSIHIKYKETSRIVARLVLYWRHNVDLEQELTAPYWSNNDPYSLRENDQLRISKQLSTPIYGDTTCEIYVHGSYSFLHALYCDKRAKRKSEYREIAYRQYRHLMEGVMQTHERLQYLSRFYRDQSLSKVPSFLLHGNSLLYEQPHTHRLTTTIDNVMDEEKTREFQDYWQKISCLDTKSWKNLMHVHTLRLILEHDQPKYKNIHCQNASGRYTHVQCRRSMSTISNFIKNYASFALLEDTTYIKFIKNDEDDLREIETSATKGFIVIRLSKLPPTIVIHLMFTSGILDRHRAQIVYYLEEQLVNCKLRNSRAPSTCQMENILRTKTILHSSESCCILIRSPLERMLKVYTRNFVNDYLLNNMAYGLPGSCPYNLHQSIKSSMGNLEVSKKTARGEAGKVMPDDCNPADASNRFNLVFGKYLFGIRVVQTLTNLPHDVISSLISNILSKISAILVNLRIKQGFHIAINNSGIMNLVVELNMLDQSNQNNHSSSCLCQYIAFPPTVTNCHQNAHSVLNNANVGLPTSKAGSLSGSLANSDNYIKNTQDSASNTNLRSTESCEVKIIKEYWIEQQYGLSAPSESYHSSLEAMRYSEVFDHLFKSDSAIFEFLLTYDLLQLLCDQSSVYYDLDASFVNSEPKLSPILSPTMSTNSSNIIEPLSPNPVSTLPSTFIEGNSKDGIPKIPLIESEYRFSVVQFLDYCQQATMNILLFKDHSDFFEPDDLELGIKAGLDNSTYSKTSGGSTSGFSRRKMSMDVNEHESDHNKREHRPSYQLDSSNTFTYMNPLYSPSLNHLFLETLHKRLKQMNDKELSLTEADLRSLPAYLKKRITPESKELSMSSANSDIDCSSSSPRLDRDQLSNDEEVTPEVAQRISMNDSINWRCFLKKGNQENLLISIIPASLGDVTKWVNFVHGDDIESSANELVNFQCESICPIFVFRCSDTMMNDQVLSFLNEKSFQKTIKDHELEADVTLHFGQPCRYMSKLYARNDELGTDLLPSIRIGALDQVTSDEKTLEVVHFRTFLRKIKNTVMKSRFSSLNDSYLSELFIHKDDISYYLNNVDMDTQKKFHVSSQLKSLADFIKSYEDYNDLLPEEPSKTCDNLLNSILLQKCGLFVNQPITRFDESNPLMKHLHDRKLLHMMRCNYKVKLPILEENLASSKFLKKFIKPSGVIPSYNHQSKQQGSSTNSSTTALPTAIMNDTSLSSSVATPTNQSLLASSLGRSELNRLSEVKSGSVGAQIGSPSALFPDRHGSLWRTDQNHMPRFSPSSTITLFPTFTTDNLILEAFRGLTCPIIETRQHLASEDHVCIDDVSSRHEAHTAEVLRRKSERKESHHYRRVLKSKAIFNQSNSAIDQALKRVDSLGRLEHFCLTPLLFSPSWRSKLAPVRDHTIEPSRYHDEENYQDTFMANGSVGAGAKLAAIKKSSDMLMIGGNQPTLSQQQEADEKWHQTVCNNYINEYLQYIQTLGFNSVQIRYPANAKNSNIADVTSQSPSNKQSSRNSFRHSGDNSQQAISTTLQTKGSMSRSPGTSPLSSSASTYNTGYLIKFLNGGCLVFKVGFCKPYVYSILYSIEGERYNNSNARTNMTFFLDELDNTKVTMHLHSFTYDYHLRSIYSYISRRQLSFSPDYHLISFVDDFRKYYQKAPNYARNHILSGEITLSNLKVTGQQLYNHIVTHNSAYNLDVLKMSSDLSHLISNLSSRFMDSQNSDTSSVHNNSIPQDVSHLRSHANDYVLVELKREKVRYRDGKDLDVFDCGLLITHDFQQTNVQKNSLTLKYFLLLTNQRELYPKLVHSDDNVISLGCHRPIRLGVSQLAKPQQSATEYEPATAVFAPSSGVSDTEDLQSSGETSGPQSMISTANSVQSSNSGLQFGPPVIEKAIPVIEESSLTSSMQNPEIRINLSKDSPEMARSKLSSVQITTSTNTHYAQSSHQIGGDLTVYNSTSSNEADGSLTGGEGSPVPRRKRTISSTSSTFNDANNRVNSNSVPKERAICDEEITYLGYFSSEEMDMLKFLQEKTASLRLHIEKLIKQAEVHYRRDSLWQKLMQRQTTKSDEIPLSIDELSELMTIVEAIDLATLDEQISLFSTLHFNWYVKLAKSFMDLKQSGVNQHKIYYVKASKNLLLYIDPKCTSAFILLSMDNERGCIELNMLIKDRQECGRVYEKTPPTRASSRLENSSTLSSFELDPNCQQLISDFINFCATFMWSTFLAA